MNLCIIPARGGSKRIPRKNIKLFCGQPIIKYALFSACSCGLFDEKIISTDDEEIRNMFPDYVPFMRSPQAANDFATLVDVINDVLKNLKVRYEDICVIYPTALAVDSDTIIKFKKVFDESGADCVFSVKKYSHPIERAFRQHDKWLTMNEPAHMFTRTQDLPQWYYDVGQIYWIKTDSFINQQKIFMAKKLGIELDAIDIDTPEEWTRAEKEYISRNCEI